MRSTLRLAPAPRRRATALVALLAALAVAGCGAALAEDPAAGTPSSATSPATADPTAPRTAAPTAHPAAPPTADPTASPAAPPIAAADTPAPLTATATPLPPRQPYAMNLYRQGDFVAQYTFEWCVGASLQMALNMTKDDNNRSRAYQAKLWEMARVRSTRPWRGANPVGWTAALNDLGIGPYTLVSLPDFDQALRVAAKAIRDTKRPVGLVMWRGRHAWVMSGFESIGDPAIHANARVTGIRVLDPLYPHGSATWGPSPKPNTLIRPATLAKQYVIRDRGRTKLGVPPGYLLILPTSEEVAR